jgi:hypothetical protein
MKLLKSAVVLITGILSVVYLLNFDAGIFEFLPDNIPLIGNLDEVLATTVLLNCLAYFGLDLRRYFGRSPPPKKTVDV